MNFLFYLDNILIDEPVGFADISLRIKRDEQWHGIFFEATTNDLKFYGTAANYLMNKKRNEGMSAEVVFKAIVDCGEADEIFEGRLDFRQYKEQCGATCFVTIPVEQTGCTMTLRNRYDQKVDLTESLAFDKLTVLPNYDGLNFAMELAAQKMKARIEGYVAAGGEEFNLDIFPYGTGPTYRGKQYAVRPNYANAVVQSIDVSQLTPTVQAASDNGVNDSALSPVLLLDDSQQCYDNDVTYEGRIKGSVQVCMDDDTGPGPNASFAMYIRVVKGNDAPFGTTTLLHELTIVDGVFPIGLFNYDFDLPFSGSTNLADGEGFFAYFFLDTNSDTRLCDLGDNHVTFDEETYIIINSEKECPPTDAVVSMVNETAARVVEAITDRCLTVKSDYYGRTDSDPYTSDEDGCGSLRILTNGLRIRNALTQNHFISLKEIFESLSPIDNIGMGVERGDVVDVDWLRIEPVEYFYQDTEIIRHPNIPAAEFSVNPDQAFSLIKVGYKKWETEDVNGLDEFNSNKEFRTSLKSINNQLDATSGFIAGGYPIEHTREQSFVETGEADTKYDNDTFIICVTRAQYAYGNYVVEQGNIGSAANFYSPSTAYNWRIRPMYNLMRWWKSVAQSYVNLVNSASKLFFSAGVGNILAEGELAAYDPCRIESRVMAENDDLGKTDMVTGTEPIWKPETMTYRYPMSLKDYNTIKANPKGYIYAQCGNGGFVKGFIQNINYRIAKGDADITLKLKWDTE